MKILRKIILVVLLLPILLVLASFFLPSKYRVERSAVITAPPETIYPWLAQLRRWPEWTGWNTSADPTLVNTYSGPAEGAGAEMSWSAKTLGNGVIKLTKAETNTGVNYELNFENGRLISGGAVTMAAADGGTKLTWSNEGKFGFNPVARYFGLFFDKLMGADFEKNLANLKQKVEPKAN